MRLHASWAIPWLAVVAQGLAEALAKPPVTGLPWLHLL